MVRCSQMLCDTLCSFARRKEVRSFENSRAGRETLVSFYVRRPTVPGRVGGPLQLGLLSMEKANGLCEGSLQQSLVLGGREGEHSRGKECQGQDAPSWTKQGGNTGQQLRM